MQFAVIKLLVSRIRDLQKVNNNLSLRSKTRPTWTWFLATFLSCEIMTVSEWDLDILRAHVSLGRSSPKQQLMGGWTGELTLNPEPFPLYFTHKIHGMHMWCPLRQVRHLNQKEFYETHGIWASSTVGQNETLQNTVSVSASSHHQNTGTNSALNTFINAGLAQSAHRSLRRRRRRSSTLTSSFSKSHTFFSGDTLTFPCSCPTWSNADSSAR